MKKLQLIFLMLIANQYLIYAEQLNVPNRLNSFYKQNKQVTDDHELKVGDKFYDFEAYDAVGKIHKFSSFIGKYILLDISSIRCAPCVAAAPELRVLTQKYKGKLRIVSLSPDTKADWFKGIKDQKVNWISLNDGKGLRGKTMLKYYAPGIPSFFVISPEGIIKETWVGYEKLKSDTGNLEKHLIKYLKKA